MRRFYSMPIPILDMTDIALFRSVTMRTSAILVVMLLGNAACGSKVPAASLDIKLTGTYSRGGETTAFSALSAWGRSDGVPDAFTPSGAGPFETKSLTGATRATFLLSSTGSGYGVGPNVFSASAKVAIKDDQLDIDFGRGFVVERMRFTGQQYSPVELTGTLKGSSSDNMNLSRSYTAAVEGKLVLHADCSGEAGGVAFSSGVFCGENLLPMTIQTGNDVSHPEKGTFGAPSGDCPTEVLAAFVDGSAFDYTVDALRVGNGKALRCIQTFDLSNTKVPFRTCGESVTGVQADGCTWTVDAFSNPAKLMAVLGVANEGCMRPQGRYCSSGLQAKIP